MRTPDTVFLIKVTPRTPGMTFFYAYAESIGENSSAIVAENAQAPRVTNDNADGTVRFSFAPRFLGDLSFPSDRYAALAYPVDRPSWFYRKPAPATKSPGPS